MAKISLIVPDYLGENRIFSLEHRDDCFVGFRLLRDEFSKRGVSFDSSDVCPQDDVDMYVFLDDTTRIHRQCTRKNIKKICFLFESPFIATANYTAAISGNFNKVFSWHVDYCEQFENWEKIDFSQNLVVNERCFESRKRKFSVLVCSAKRQGHGNPLNLYGFRHDLVEYCESNQNLKFDLYGVGWEKRTVFDIDFVGTGRLRKILMLFLPTLSPPKCYRGIVDAKLPVMSEYDFAFCSENYRGPMGYITEKIWDAMMAGCIPVYHGAHLQNGIIPRDLYIDPDDFPNFSELFLYLESITEQEKLQWQLRIKCFLNEKANSPFDARYFAKTACRSIMNEFEEAG